MHPPWHDPDRRFTDKMGLDPFFLGTIAAAIVTLGAFVSPETSLLPSLLAGAWLTYASASGGRWFRNSACLGTVAGLLWMAVVFVPVWVQNSGIRFPLWPFGGLWVLPGVVCALYYVLTSLPREAPSYMLVITPVLVFTPIVSFGRWLAETTSIANQVGDLVLFLMFAEYGLFGLSLVIGSSLALALRGRSRSRECSR